MYPLRRWWNRYGLQVFLVALAIAIALILRQTQGATIFEIYQSFLRPFQGKPVKVDVLTNARVLELQSRLAELETQNQQLKDLLGYVSSPPLVPTGGPKADPQAYGAAIVAPIVGRSADHWWQEVTIGQGSSRGIQPGDMVTAPGGLVGQVTKVTPSTSQVLLISDPSSKVGVIVTRGRYAGFLRGQSSSRGIVEFFEKAPDIRRGDTIVTSQYSQRFPAGVPVGRVESVNLYKSPSPEAVIEFSSPISQLEWVVVYGKR